MRSRELAPDAFVRILCEVQERDCMLGLDALRQLGMSPPDHMPYLPPPPQLSPV